LATETEPGAEVPTSASVVEILVFFWMAIFEANRLLAFGFDLPAVASCLVSQDLAIVVVPFPCFDANHGLYALSIPMGCIVERRRSYF